jgi:hypothetical protein
VAVRQIDPISGTATVALPDSTLPIIKGCHPALVAGPPRRVYEELSP